MVKQCIVVVMLQWAEISDGSGLNSVKFCDMTSQRCHEVPLEQFVEYLSMWFTKVGAHITAIRLWEGGIAADVVWGKMRVS